MRIDPYRLLAVLELAIVAAGLGCAPAGSPTATAEAENRGATATRIQLPDVLAVEVPAPAMTTIAPAESPLREVLESATAGRLRVTHDQTAPFPLGATLVTWTAWQREPEASPIEATRRAWVYVFPFGQTPAGVTRQYNAVGGNHSAKIVRDASGGVHIAWLETGRQGTGRAVAYRRGVHDPATGRVSWQTPPIPVSDDRSGAGFVGIEASANAVHFAWIGRNDTTRYRRLIRSGAEWRFEPIRDTGVAGASFDNGSDIAVRGDDEIHVLTYGGQYARSTDGGASWRREQVPWPSAGEKKNPAIAVDSLGNAHVVFTLVVHSPQEWTSSKPNGGYWQMRYIRRQAQGGWQDAHDVLGNFPEWGDRGATRDALADWADIAVDRHDNIHLAFHGTAISGIYGRDQAFYTRRPATGPGRWAPWQPPQPLHPVDPAKRQSFSFAPSLSMDPDSDAVVAVVFFERTDLPRELFDADAVVLRNGTVAGAPIALSRWAGTAAEAGRPQDALSTWFPSAAPRLFRDATGRAWLDVLQVAETPERHRSVHYVVYQRLGLTGLVPSVAPR